VEKTNVGVVGLIIKKIVKIHHKPQPPTLISTSHAPIAMHMGMMPIITSHFTQNYNRASPKILMPVRAKVLGKFIKGKVQLTRHWPPN
jgi:hypothetical protein